MNLSRIFYYVAFLAVACALPACKRDNEQPGGDKGGDGGSVVQVAFVSNNAETFWNYAEAGCKKAAAESNGKFQAIFRRPPVGTPDAQRKVIDELMDNGIKGIAVSPNDADNFVTFLRNEVNAKIPLVMADNDLPDPSARRCYVGTHNYRAGRAMGALIKKHLPKGENRIKIAIFVGQMDAPNAVERRQGLLDYLAGIDREEIGEKMPAGAKDLPVGADYILVDTITDDVNQNKCRARADDLLNRRPDVDCLIGLWEYNPPALLYAVRDSKLPKKPLIAAFDENFATMEGIQSGEIIGSIVQNPFEFGYLSVKILAGLARGDDSVLKRPDIDSKNRIYIPHRVVVKNAKEKIGGSETVDVDVFFAQLKNLGK